MGGRRNAVYIWTVVVLAILAGLSIVPTPFYVLAPGGAIDLGERITVAGHAAPERRLYLTDVVLARASVLLLAAAVLPGTRIVRRDRVLPVGESARGYDRVMSDAMGESQNVAGIVAERAAGLRVEVPPSRVCIADVPQRTGSRVLRRGDCFARVGATPIRIQHDLKRALASVGRARSVRVRVLRDGAERELDVPTIATAHGARLGVLVIDRVPQAHLPVAVRFAFDDVSGSSGGLMFALHIYSALHGGRAGEPVAGTGTIALDGTVGPIEGTRQKLIAAQRAGAKLFLVPVANYAEISHESGIRIVPVKTFAAALHVLRS